MLRLSQLPASRHPASACRSAGRGSRGRSPKSGRTGGCSASSRWTSSSARSSCGSRAGHIVLRRDLDFDVRLRAVVLNTPSHVLEPEGVLRLGGDAAVGQRVARSMPITPPHVRMPISGPSPISLKGVAEDVAVRASAFVG